MISTRGRYALRVMIELSESKEDSLIPMKMIAARQGISLKYLERILPPLTKAGLIEGIHGAGGGYRLAKAPSSITVGDILRLTEVDMAPVACLAEGADPCERRQICRTIAMWEGYQKVTNDYFDNITLADLTTDSPILLKGSE